MPILLLLGLITSGRSAMLSEIHVSIIAAQYRWPLHNVYVFTRWRYSKNLKRRNLWIRLTAAGTEIISNQDGVVCICKQVFSKIVKISHIVARLKMAIPG